MTVKASYAYGVSNQRIIRTAGTTRTLYPPGMEVTDTAGTVAATRYLTIGGTVIGAKTGAGTVIFQGVCVTVAAYATTKVAPKTAGYITIASTQCEDSGLTNEQTHFQSRSDRGVGWLGLSVFCSHPSDRTEPVRWSTRLPHRSRWL